MIGIRGDVNDSSRNEYGQEVGMVEQSKINTYGILKACRHNIVEIYHGREDKQKPWRDRGVSRLQSFFNDEHGSYEELKSNLDTNVWDFWQPHMQQLQEAGKINVLELREAPDSKDFNGQIHTLEVDFGQERAIIEAVRGRGV
ncbi:MAG: hypothetical protein COV36_00065 [Alphaproteobacteria bacterium CG11_big_fil_rev_8_21_14_0_20_44_7]|nr:MAG: hypothetical protein COV36_00065 [Alphaproteobacteria bacterium CG11_big_fil_rev_8_21_14_0_20_44_7]